MGKRREKEKKHKLIRKGQGEEPTVIEFNLSKAVILLIIIGVIIAGILTKEIVTTIIETKQTELLANEEEIDIQDLKEVNGDLGYISSAKITSVKTGVGPFDKNDDPGNDSSEDNNIVRSFDQVTWTIDLTMALKDGVAESGVKGGVIDVEVSLPTDCANVMTWDLNSMQWLENGQVSSDGITLTGQYSMSETSITVPGKQTLVFVLSVEGAANKTEIIPTFKFKLVGNEETEKKVITGKPIIVSATGKYNIQLIRNTRLNTRVLDLNYNGEQIDGRLYGYTFILQLYNDDASKGLKGIEYPQGEISFNINLKFQRNQFDSKDLEDITDECTPLLWNYSVNGGKGLIADRKMNFGSDTETNIYAPYGIGSDRNCTVYNSGNISMSQSGSIIKVTVKDYDFDGKFLKYNSNYIYTTTPEAYGENIGCFSVGYLQLIVPDTEASIEDDRNYSLTVSDSDFVANSFSEQNITNQVIQSDDSITITHVRYKAGSFYHIIYLRNDKGTSWLPSTLLAGDSTVTIGEEFRARSYVSIDPQNDSDDYLRSIDRFFKFDGDALEVVNYDSNKEINIVGMDNMTWKCWYVTKKDGTNWTSQSDMNNGNIEDMVLYEKLSDIPKGDICIGIFIESVEGYIQVPTAYDTQYFEIKLRVKDSAKVNNSYGMTQRSKYWRVELDRSIYSQSILHSYDSYPNTVWDSGNRQYIKTEYNENGEIISGTHSAGPQWGNTVFVIGANLYGNIRAIDSNKADKVNYNLGKNENIVTYSLEPKLNVNKNIVSQIEDVILKAKVILPQGLEYVLGSSRRGEESYNEPEIEKNDDGSTTLVWNIYGVTSGLEIEPILFDAQIDNNSNNGMQYETTFIISEEVGEDGEAKIGNSEVKNRTSTESINIINLASFRLYKEVETPVIEKNGEIHFTITVRNSDRIVYPEFSILDIMPYNEDDRGTNYNGTYTISRITINQNINGTPVENNELKLYITKETTKSGQAEQYEEIRNVTAKDEDLGTSEIWEEIQGTNGEYTINKEQANDGITAIAIKGELVEQAEIVVEIYMETSENQGEDKYVNSASAQTQIITEVVQTSKESAQVIERTIVGKVWLDTNFNSIIDNNEDLGDIDPEKVVLKLYKVNEGGTLEEAVDIDGNQIQTKHPDKTGYYKFNGLPAGNYVVEVQYDGEIYELVEKEAMSNIEVTSKFEQKETGKGQTELITKLNSSSNLRLEENNVNVGLIKKINLEFIKVAEENHNNKIGGTEFKLYKLVCTEHEEGYHDNEQIDTSNVNRCWELIGTEESSSNKEDEGRVEFKDLQFDTIYRLVETKASLNRIKPNGQWQIKIINTLEDTKSENTQDTEQTEKYIKIDEYVGLQITAIGTPPGFAITKDEQTGIAKELLLPNRAYFQFPTSGSIGTKTIYQIGIAIIGMGILLIISRKYILLKSKTKSKRKHK